MSNDDAPGAASAIRHFVEHVIEEYEGLYPIDYNPSDRPTSVDIEISDTRVAKRNATTLQSRLQAGAMSEYDHVRLGTTDFVRETFSVHADVGV